MIRVWFACQHKPTEVREDRQQSDLKCAECGNRVRMAQSNAAPRITMAVGLSGASSPMKVGA
jgi:hypothetical protein